MKPQLQFSNKESLCSWLTLTLPGKAILDALLPEWMLTETAAFETELRAEVECRLARRACCLIVCRADGAIEAYGDQVNVHFADMLDTDGAEAVTEAEAYLEDNLPPKFRRLVTQRSTIHYPEHRTPEQEHARLFELQCFRAIPRLKDQEAERLREEAERREKLARDKYPPPAPF